MLEVLARDAYLHFLFTFLFLFFSMHLRYATCAFRCILDNRDKDEDGNGDNDIIMVIIIADIILIGVLY